MGGTAPLRGLGRRGTLSFPVFPIKSFCSLELPEENIEHKAEVLRALVQVQTLLGDLKLEQARLWKALIELGGAVDRLAAELRRIHGSGRRLGGGSKGA
jgi:hypothetical protein